ncbi:MAG: hypothetical protein AB8B74_06185 [Crocinitomicaceae bacterium]
MRKFIYFIIIICFNISCNDISSDNSPIVFNSDSFKELNIKEFKINYPDDWDVDTTGRYGVSFFIISPQSDKNDSFKENVNCFVENLTDSSMTLGKYTSLTEHQLTQMVTEYEPILNIRDSSINGAYQNMVYSGRQGKKVLTFQQYYWVKNSKAIVLTLTCEKTQYEAYKMLGKAILDSFTIK